MTRLVPVFACLVLLALAAGPAAAQDEETKPAPKKAAKPASAKSSKAEKKEPHLEIAIKFDGKSDDFDVPARAIPMLTRAVTAAKKSKGDSIDFEAVITIEQAKRRFTNPTDAVEAVKAIGEAMRDLKKAGTGFDDLGEIPDATPDDLKFDAKKIAAGRAELERRVTLAMQQQNRGAGNAGGLGARPQVPTARPAPQVPNPQQLQQRQQELKRIYDEEVAKAKQEGILPANFDAAPAQQSAPQSPEERKNAVLEEVRTHLRGTYGKGEKVGGEPAEKPAEKPAAAN